jgi:hypothetical protein
MSTVLFVTRNGTSAGELIGAEVKFFPDTDTYTLDQRINGLGGNDILQSMLLPLEVDGRLINFVTTLDGGVGDDALTGNNVKDIINGGAGHDTTCCCKMSWPKALRTVIFWSSRYRRHPAGPSSGRGAS